MGILTSKVSEIKDVKKGETIGYSNSEIAKHDMKIAIVPVGYSDGFNRGNYNSTFKTKDKIRLLKNAFFDIFKDKHIYQYIDNQRCRVVGIVGMNHVAFDIANKDIKCGSTVEFDTSPINISSNIRREYI